MATAQKIITKAKSFIGTKESPVNSNNVIFNTEYYGKTVSGSAYPWCMVFVWYVFKECGASTLLYDGKKTALCMTAGQWFKDNGQWFSEPKAGDVVFFKFGTNSRWTNHVGIVESVNSDGTINTIEGNTSLTSDDNGGSVMQRKRSSSIVGYGRPKYDIISSITSKPPVSISTVLPDYGIDVSSYQGVIDWNKVKSAGCKFAILKIIRKDLNTDTQFENNVRGCDNVGMRWDVYNYSYATTVAKAKSDAEKVISILNGRKSIVWLDVEDTCQKNLGHLLIDIINKYKTIIEASGNAFGVYTGLSFYNSYIKPYASEINCPFWIARYYNGHNQMNFGVTPNSQYKPGISHPLYGWQYTSSGKISGVSGNVDINIRYMENICSSNSSTYLISNSSASSKLCGYVTANHLNIRKYPNSNNTTPIVGTLNYGDDVHITAYNNGWFEVDTNEWVSGKYIKGSKIGKVNASSLNFRATPAVLPTNKIKSYPRNTKVEIVGESGDWYITKYGYCSKKYITLI